MLNSFKHLRNLLIFSRTTAQKLRKDILLSVVKSQLLIAAVVGIAILANAPVKPGLLGLVEVKELALSSKLSTV